jgi:uncharacterized protein (TIGR02996 family)
MSLQVPDWITFRGRQWQLLSYPLDIYVRDLPAQPDFRLRGSGRDRGYVASWHIADDYVLWLTDLVTRPDRDRPDPGLAVVFPAGEPVAATWVNHPLLTADVQHRRFSLFGNGTVQARETYLSVWRGRLVMVEEVDGKTGRRIGGELTPPLDAALGPDHGAFLRAVVAAGDDMAPRLVYADWLDERNDGRGQIIRLAERLLQAEPELTVRRPPYYQPRWFRRTDAWLWFEAMGYHRFLRELIDAWERGGPRDL